MSVVDIGFWWICFVSLHCPIIARLCRMATRHCLIIARFFFEGLEVFFDALEIFGDVALVVEVVVAEIAFDEAVGLLYYFALEDGVCDEPEEFFEYLDVVAGMVCGNGLGHFEQAGKHADFLRGGALVIAGGDALVDGFHLIEEMDDELSGRLAGGAFHFFPLAVPDPEVEGFGVYVEDVGNFGLGFGGVEVEVLGLLLLFSFRFHGLLGLNSVKSNKIETGKRICKIWFL